MNQYLHHLREPNAVFVTKSFLHLLDSNGLGVRKAVDIAELTSFNYEKTSEPLKSIFGLLSNSIQKPKGLVPLDYGSVSVKRRWHRLGLESGEAHAWTPGLFFGVMFEGKDHGVRPSNEKFGPDLCLILDIASPYHRTLKDYYFKGRDFPDYKALVSDWQNLAKKIGWQFHDNIAEPELHWNIWHPLYLRIPLAQAS